MGTVVAVREDGGVVWEIVASDLQYTYFLTLSLSSLRSSPYRSSQLVVFDAHTFLLALLCMLRAVIAVVGRALTPVQRSGASQQLDGPIPAKSDSRCKVRVVPNA